MDKRQNGFTTMELVIASGLVGILAVVGAVTYIGYQRSSETVDALATISIMRERLAVLHSTNSEKLMVCDDSVVRPGDLENDYMALSISALTLEDADPSAGYGGGVVVAATADKDGGSGVAAVRTLHDELVGEGAEVRGAVLTDSVASFSVLITPKGTPYCQPPALAVASGSATSTPAASAASTSSATSPTVPDPALPRVSLAISVQQEVFDTGADGRAVVRRMDTGGNMDAMTLEFSVVGTAGGSRTAGSGPVIFNYGTTANNNLVSAWRPSNFTIALQGKNYPSDIDLTDGNSHRVTISWDAGTGALKVFDNGVLKKEFADVSSNAPIPGDGYLVLGQKMNDPGSQSGWRAGEHYAGQIFGASLATKTYSDADIAAAPLYSRSGDLVTDIRSQGGTMVDVTGNQTVAMQGNPSVSTVNVNTDLALVPPGATVKVTPSAAPGDNRSRITSINLMGLGGLTITDRTGRSSTGNTDVTDWDLGSLSIKLPAGFSNNVTLRAIVGATTDENKVLLASAEAVLRMSSN